MSELGVKCAGHEGSGVIVKVGERVRNYRVGQRAGVKPTWDVCHTCVYCRSGREMFCDKNIECGGQIDGMLRYFGWLGRDADVSKALTSNTLFRPSATLR